MNRRRPFAAIAAGAAWSAALSLSLSLSCVAACGGRVDGGTSSGGSAASGTAGTSGGVMDGPPRRPSGSKPGRPSAPLGNAAVGSMIAEDYCKAFSSCCVGDGQPPIDVSHCRELTSAAVEKELDAGGVLETSAADVAVCVSAIHTRVAACSKDDVRWPAGSLAIFAPASVQSACKPLLPKVSTATSAACSASAPCQAPDVCAIDQCSTSAQVGLACTTSPCFDAANCIGGECLSASLAGVGAKCATDVDCRIGLVCFGGTCAPTRDHPELATPRSSPYRIGADTCSAYDYL